MAAMAMASSHKQDPCSAVVGDHDENLQMMKEQIQRGQWIRAAILGANDGLLSITSLMLGIGAAKKDRRTMVLAGLAGALAGACSMAVGEFVSVSTQREIQKAATTGDRLEHEHVINIKEAELSNRLPPIFSPGRSPMMKVIAEDAINTNTSSSKFRDRRRDEQEVLPNPSQAAAASALAFLCGSVVPLVPAILIAGYVVRLVVIAVVTSIALALFGGLGAHLGGSMMIRASAVRVLIGGWVAMGITYGLLRLFDCEN